jgi:crotonobetainyl-CoA:carnitine CoA-transferase CaiB-like acyl-CoA transferase
VTTGLDGIRVLEVAGGVGVAWAGKLFADLGADVVRLEGAHDVVRARPHNVHAWLNTNKRAIDDEPATRRELIVRADIVFHGLSPTRASAEGLTFAELTAIAPPLVLCSITPWGMTGPYANYEAEELTIIHGSSWGFLSPGAATRADLPPLKAPGHHATINVATVAATAALAAFDRAQRTGVGEHVDFSCFAAAAKMTEFAPATVTFLGLNPSRLGTKSVVPWGTYRCRDGLVQIIAPEENQWQALVALMGQPDWAKLDELATAEGRRRNPDVVDIYLAEWFATQSVRDVFHAGQRAGICLNPVNRVAELANDEHLAARRFLVETPSGERLPGPGARITPGGWALHRDAPAKGEHNAQGWLAPSREPAAGHSSPAGPLLEGVRVLDFTWVWAGPFCTQHLGHLGADVIRVESPDRADIFRRMPFTPKGVKRTLDTSGPFQIYNSDKRSVAVDLRHRDARSLILRMVERCDVVVENFSVGTMAQLGLGVEDLRSANPSVIVASLTGYGQTGPYARYTAYGPAGGAMTGLFAANGYADGDAAETGIAVGDPGLGIAAAWAIVAALVSRQRGGEPARVDAAMVEAVATTLGEPWMEYVTTGENPPRRGNHDIVWTPHNCYPAAGEDQWVTIACTTGDAWSRLCSVIDDGLADDERFITMTLRKQHEDDLDAIVAAWTSSQDRWEVARRLQAVGVAAFPSLSPADLWRGDPHLAALGMLEQPDHPATGNRTIPGVPWRLTNGPNGLRRRAPLIGEHTDEVLRELLQCDAVELADLHHRGVLAS